MAVHGETEFRSMRQGLEDSIRETCISKIDEGTRHGSFMRLRRAHVLVLALLLLLLIGQRSGCPTTATS